MPFGFPPELVFSFAGIPTPRTVCMAVGTRRRPRASAGPWILSILCVKSAPRRLNPTPPALLGGREFPHHLIKIKARGLLADGELFEALKPVGNHGLGAEVDVSPVYHPVVVQE